MRILILESVSGGLHPEIDVRLLSEGFAMLRTMASEFSDGGFDVITILDKRLGELANWLDAKVLMSRNGLDAVLGCRPDAALVIAPEKERELEGITAKLRKRGVEVLGPQAETIRICANKWLTHRMPYEVVPQPKTWKEPRATGRVLIKPVDGIGCEGIRFATSSRGSTGVIFQEFLEGEHASCCLMMEKGKGIALSVNRQEIVIKQDRFTYVGGAIPFDHPLQEKCAEIALKAAKCLGLRGYCGVDLVVGDSPYFIEANPRVTTSFVALARVLRANLGKILVNALIDDAAVPKPQLDGCSLVKIPRAKGNTKINVDKLSKLREIPGVVSPPFTFNGNLQKGSPLFVVAESGSTIEDAEHKFESTLNEAAALVGVDLDAIAWS